MTPKSPTAYEQTMAFVSANSAASLLLMAAAHDYAAARCLLLSNLFTGLAIGVQAVEKFLKAFILLKNPAAKAKAFSHDISRLLGEADRLDPAVGLAKFAPLATRLDQYYAARYPDNPNQPRIQDTGEIFSIDELVVHLNENLSCPRNMKYRTGLYALALSSKNLRVVPSWEEWIWKHNRALGALRPQIEAEYSATMAELYPAV